jgi:hypothetical protein
MHTTSTTPLKSSKKPLTAGGELARNGGADKGRLPNFADAGRPGLADLISNLITTHAAAEAACSVQSRAEEKFKFGKNLPRPKVFGGVTESWTITRADGETVECAGGEWFYSHREEIENSDSDRKADLLAEFDRQEKDCQRAYPGELRKAERASSRALDAWTKAERALVQYRPTSAAEAVELLALAGKQSGKGLMPYLEIDDSDLQTIIRNCTAVLQKEFTH